MMMPGYPWAERHGVVAALSKLYTSTTSSISVCRGDPGSPIDEVC